MRVDEQIGVVVAKSVGDFAYVLGIENLTGCLLYVLLHSKVLAVYIEPTFTYSLFHLKSNVPD